MSNKEIHAFALKYGKARAADHKADLTRLILEELDRATTKDYRRSLHSTLAHEYAFLGKLDEAERIHRKIMAMNGEHPLDYMNYAMYLHYWAKNLESALAAADRAYPLQEMKRWLLN